MFNNQAGSRRWTHFHSALQLAIQRSAHKWTFEDFAECFPLYVESDKNGSSATFNSISEYIEAQNFRDLDKLFTDYNIQESIDTLHKVVNDAKDRKARNDAGNDVWKEDLDPKVAVCARTVPMLTSEVARLRAEIAKLEEENKALEVELQENVNATTEANEHGLDFLENFEAAFKKWSELPYDDMERWTLEITESLRPSLGS